MYGKLFIIVQSSHYLSKFGPADISQVIQLEPMDLTIEACLGEEGEVEKILFQASELLVLSPKEQVHDRTESGATCPC